MSKPSVLILHAPGTNRDGDAAHACRLAGGSPEIVHIRSLMDRKRSFDEFDMLLLPGGFSYGDALGAGVRQALDLTVFFAEELHAFVESGRRVLGICNGFQVLVKAGILPGANGASTADRQVTLTHNRRGRFECRWVHLAVEPSARAGFLGAIRQPIFCPVAHGEGNFQTSDRATAEQLEETGLVAFRYIDAHGAPARGRYPLNPNGSVADIAGICNAAGNVVGLMPHPENHVDAIQNPLGRRADKGLGLQLFTAMIQH